MCRAERVPAHNQGGVSLAKPHGRPPKVGTAIEVTLADHDKRLVDQLCHIMNVGYRQCFHILLNGALDLARESHEIDAQPLGGSQVTYTPNLRALGTAIDQLREGLTTTDDELIALRQREKQLAALEAESDTDLAGQYGLEAN